MDSPPSTPPSSPGYESDDWRFRNIMSLTEWVENYRPGGFHPVHLGDIFKGSRYKVIRKLGRGSFSTVWLAQDQEETSSSRYVALKILTAKESTTQNEVAVHEILSKGPTDHPGRSNVTRLLDSFVHSGPNGNHCCLIFEAMGPSATGLLHYHPQAFGGPIIRHDDFSDDEVEQSKDASSDNQGQSKGAGDACTDEDPAERSRFPLWMTRRIMYQLMLAVDFLHCNSITHSDIQPGNILIPIRNLSSIAEDQLSQVNNHKTHISVRRKDGKIDLWAPRYVVINRSLAVYVDLHRHFQIKVSDLGSAFRFDEPPEEPVTPMGLRSPEMICSGKTGPTQDIWSLGCLIFEFITGSKLFTVAPFGGSDDETDDDDHYLQLSDRLGPLPQSILDEWPRASVYFNSKGEKIRNYIGELPENFDPAEIEAMPSLEFDINKKKPVAMSDEEATMVKELLRSMLTYAVAARPTTSSLLRHSWFAKIKVED